MRTLVHRPKGMRLTLLREELLVFFAGDHCAAHLAHALERKTAALIERMEDKGETEGLLWLEITEESLHKEMLGAYGITAIRKALHLMESKGILACSRPGIGMVKSYLYNYDLVDSCVESRTINDLSDTPSPSVISPMTPSVVSPMDHAQFHRCTSVISPMLNKESEFTDKRTYKNIDDEEFASLSENQPPPTPEAPPNCPTLDTSEENLGGAVDLCLEDPIEVFCKNAYRQRKGGHLENLRTKAAQRVGGILEKLISGEEETGKTDFRTALLAFLATEDEWLRKNSWPLRSFLKSPSKYLPSQSRATRKVHATPLNPAQAQSPTIIATTDTPRIATGQIQAPPKIDGRVLFEELWNAYHRKGRVKKPLAMEEYKKNVRHTDDHLRIMRNLKEYWIPSKLWAEGFVDHLSNWLANHRWEEEPEPEKEKYVDTYTRLADAHFATDEEIRAEAKALGLKLNDPR